MIDLDKATIADMRAYARDELGLQIPKNMMKDSIAEAIREADPSLFPEPATPGEELPKAAAQKNKVTIMIHKTGEKGGDRDVPIGVNGRISLVQRGVEVEVPRSVLEVLKNAKETRWEWVPNNSHPQGGELVSREAHAYPFSVVG